MALFIEALRSLHCKVGTLQQIILAVKFSGEVLVHGTWFTQTGGQTGISSFGEAPDGTLYAISQFTGTMYKVIVTGALAC